MMPFDYKITDKQAQSSLLGEKFRGIYQFCSTYE